MKKKIKLINGQFSANDAHEILMDLYTKNIQFNNVKNFSSQIRFGNDDQNALKRVEELKENLADISSIISQAKNQNKNNPAQTISTGQDYSLNKSELEFLLLLIKKSTFIGEQIEEVYNTVYKLQQQYLDIK